MRAFRLCRSTYPPYDGEGARRAGGRWNSKGIRVLYMSENRSLTVLEVLVHLSGVLPDKYFLGSAEIPDNMPVERIVDEDLPEAWSIGHSFRPFGNCGRAELRSEPRPLGLCANRVCGTRAFPLRSALNLAGRTAIERQNGTPGACLVLIGSKPRWSLATSTGESG